MAEIFSDTIVAISTAMAPSGIGIVRLSGPEAFEIADRVYVNRKGKKLSGQKGYTVHYGNVCESGEVIDEVLAMVMRAPHSYTGEHTVEFDCHGGVLATKRVLEALIHAGARPAEPGEFSRRAFLNGRMDLSQAEAVMQLIESKNEASRQNSIRQIKGNIAEKIRPVREQILYEIAHIESALDDPEHISLDGYGDHLPFRLFTGDIKCGICTSVRQIYLSLDPLWLNAVHDERIHALRALKVIAHSVSAVLRDKHPLC
jgi:tRNA modification GTPase